MDKKKNMITITAILSLLLIIPLTTGFFGIDDALSDALGRERGPPKQAWYDVKQWEVDFCEKWGGTSSSIESGTGPVGTDSTFITHNRIISLQAERTDIIPTALRVPGLNVTVYEVAWYVQPFRSDDDINYEVYLIDERGHLSVLDSGNANYYNPAKGYQANSSSINFTKAEIKFWNEEITMRLNVTIV